MIVEMQKVTVLVSRRDRDAALERLRDLGVVHVHAVKTPASEEIHGLETELANTVRALQTVGADEANRKAADPDGAPERVAQILALGQEKDNLLRELAEHGANNRWFETWGAVSLSSLQALREAGIAVRFYVADKNALKKGLPEGQAVEVVKEGERGVYLAHFSEAPGERLDFREDPMPQVEVGAMRARMAELEGEIEAIDRRLTDLAEAADSLFAYRDDLARRLEFSNVKHGMGEEGPVAYLQGFCPTEDVDAIKNAAAGAGWAYAIQDPDDPREVPTLIRTPKWVRIINPVFSFMGTVPGYQEYDISFWFLLFLSLFYAILVGDGGYGLIFLFVTLYARRKAREAPAEPFALMYVLSGATIVWGAISGTWFGIEHIFKIEGLSFLELFTIGPLRSVGGDPKFIMKLCFFIGAVQLSIAHATIAMRYIKSFSALSQAGWICIIWALFFLTGNLVLGEPLSPAALPLLLGGGGLVLLFANFQKNILKGVLVSLGDLPLSIISSFADVVSYVRLFAVGMATFIVANSFNTMAVEFGASPVIGGLAAAMILFLGHSINIILALMAVVVHGIRLNMLEFSGHLSMQWSGKPYRPFKASPEE